MKFNMEKAYNKGSHLVFDEIAYNPSSRPGRVVQSATVKWNIQSSQIWCVYFRLFNEILSIFDFGFLVNWLNI